MSLVLTFKALDGETTSELLHPEILCRHMRSCDQSLLPVHHTDSPRALAQYEVSDKLVMNVKHLAGKEKRTFETKKRRTEKETEEQKQKKEKLCYVDVF